MIFYKQILTEQLTESEPTFTPTEAQPVLDSSSAPLIEALGQLTQREELFADLQSQIQQRDTLSLANHLFNQLERGIQLADKAHLVRRLLPPTEAALQLQGWMRHRYELVQECTRRKNKLTAICDELFPEMTRVLKDPNLSTALALHEHFPTPQALATAPFSALVASRAKSRPTLSQLEQLQQVASQNIGTKELPRQRGLLLEQSQLIRELRLLQEHIEQLDAEIRKSVDLSREGKILTSIPGIGTIQAAAILAAMGNVLNFTRASHLKAYLRALPI